MSRSLHLPCAPALLLGSLIASLMLATPSAHAGTYVGAISGGAAPTITPADASEGSSFSPGYQYAEGSADVSPMSPGANSTFTLQANPGAVPITTAFTWVPDAGQTLTTDPPPPCVLVEQDAGMRWYPRDLYGTATCDGTLDPGVPGATPSTGLFWGSSPDSPGMSSSATSYSGKSSPGPSFSVSCKPTGSYTGQAGLEGSVTGEVDLSCGASVYPITLILAGMTKDSSGNDNILIGQGCTASLSGIPSNLLPYVTYNWSVSGITFQSWSPTTPADPNALPPTPMNLNATYYVSGPGPLNIASPHWYWQDLAGPETVTCTATVTPPAGQGNSFTITATANVALKIPSSGFYYKTGRVQINNINTSTYGSGYSLYAGPTSSVPYGITYTEQVNTPAPFSQGGIWNFVQLVAPGAWYTPAGGTEQPYPVPSSTFPVVVNYNGYHGLDTQYPLAPGPYGTQITGGYADNNLPFTAFDGPALTSLLDTNVNYHVSEYFETYVMYQPPGNDSQWVPLTRLDWNWQANDAIPTFWENWNNANDAGTISATQEVNSPAFPLWSLIVH